MDVVGGTAGELDRTKPKQFETSLVKGNMENMRSDKTNKVINNTYSNRLKNVCNSSCCNLWFFAHNIIK